MLQKIVIKIINRLRAFTYTNNDLHPLEEIPRYPPFAKGLPLATTEQLLDSQKEMLNKIMLEVGQDTYEEIYLPCIKGYCDFVHLLPASERDHHRGAGGLFRHGLEVAYITLIESKHKLFDTNKPPSERVDNEPKWHLAGFLAGLVHDVGKPLSDYQAVSEDGRHIWNPFTENIVDWGVRKGISKYFLHWHNGRYRKHESLSSVVSKKIIMDEALAFLTTSDNIIIRNMFECITNQPSLDNKLYELVKKADRHSSEKDVKTANLRGDDANLAIPLEKYILDAIKLLNIQNDWGIEFIGNPPTLFLDDSLFLTAKAVKRLTEKLADNKIPGVPWDQKALTESLINTEFAVPRELEDGSKSNMWPLLKKGDQRITWAVRLADWSVVYPDRPEPSPGIQLLSEQQTMIMQSGKERDTAKEKTKPDLGTEVLPVKPGEVQKAPSVKSELCDPQENEGGQSDSEEVQEVLPVKHDPEKDKNDKPKTTESKTDHKVLPVKPENENTQEDIESQRKTENETKVLPVKPESKKDQLQGLVKEFYSRNPKKAFSYDGRQGLLVDWNNLSDSEKDSKQVLEELKDALKHNATGSFTHLKNDKPILIVKKDFVPEELRKKGGKSKTGQSKKTTLKKHREVPDDFDPLLEKEGDANSALFRGKQGNDTDKKPDNSPNEQFKGLAPNIVRRPEVQPYHDALLKGELTADEFISHITAALQYDTFAAHTLIGQIRKNER